MPGRGDVGGLFRAYMALERKRRSEVLGPAELRQWMQLKRQLNTHLQPGLEPGRADRRESVRLPTRVQVSFESYGEVQQCWMTRLSRGGLFIACDDPLPIGEKVELRIRINPDEVLDAPGEVVSLNLGPDAARLKRGMGVRFTGLSPEKQREIDELYHRTLEDAAENAGS
jgi:uncharacterized protein (TIGR02266 family)